MQHSQQSQFADRIKRIQAGGPNTCATVYTGLQDVDTPANKTVSGVRQDALNAEERLSIAQRLNIGLKSGMVKLIALGSGLLIFMHFAGV